MPESARNVPVPALWLAAAASENRFPAVPNKLSRDFRVYKTNDNSMKHLLLLCILSAISLTPAGAQSADTNRQARRNLVVKEWNTDAKASVKWLDRITVYNEKGEKIEETEYTRHGQLWRQTFTYDDNGKVLVNTLYDSKDKVELIRKFEYNEDQTRKKQYNYLPNGTLQTVKVFEYSHSDQP